MAQHFLLTAAARTLTLASVARMSDEDAERVFIRLRWSDNVSLRRRPPFLGRLDERRWVIVVGVVMGSVHKLGYGHKFEGSAATSVVA